MNKELTGDPTVTLTVRLTKMCEAWNHNCQLCPMSVLIDDCSEPATGADGVNIMRFKKLRETEEERIAKYAEGDVCVFGPKSLLKCGHDCENCEPMRQIVAANMQKDEGEADE